MECVCTGMFDVFAPELLPVLNITIICRVEICNLVLGETCGLVENPFSGVAKREVEPPLPKYVAPTFECSSQQRKATHALSATDKRSIVLISTEFRQPILVPVDAL